MDSERGFGHGSLWKKEETPAFTQVEKKKKSQGDIDLTQTTIFLYRCVMERKYEESEYFVHGWGNIISIWHSLQRLCQMSFDSEKHYLEELQI